MTHAALPSPSLCPQPLHRPPQLIRPSTTTPQPLTHSFSLAFGDSLSGYMGSPATYPFYKDVGAAASQFSSTIPLALFSLFQLKVSVCMHAMHACMHAW